MPEEPVMSYWVLSAVAVLAAVSAQALPSPACEESSCYPDTGNLLIGREGRIRASSTCGTKRTERYCIQKDINDRKMCFQCRSQIAFKDNTHLYHGIENVIRRRVGKRHPWWQSENGVESVSIQLDLETVFRFTSLNITFKTFRPAAMLIERSSDSGRTWKVYQYFAHDCMESFPGVPLGPKRHIADLVCESQYSSAEPPSLGVVKFEVLPPNIEIGNTYSSEVDNLVKITNLRINFTQLHTLGENLLDATEEVKEKYYYAIYDMVVEGSCFCNGHASQCLPMHGEPVVPGRVYSQCACAHNTEGSNCGKCKDLFDSREWKPAVGRQTNACKDVSSPETNLLNCDESSCYPATGNLLIGRYDRIQASSTCLQCQASPDYKEVVWSYHGIGNVVSGPLQIQKTWWQSENGVEKVDIHLRLETLFNFTSLTLTFKSFRPAAMLIERSSDFGRTWKVYQYFASDCAKSFPGVPLEPRREITDVVCESKYSGAEPSTGGKVIFEVLPPNIAIDNPYNPEVQNLLGITNLRINFTQLHTQAESLLSVDEAKRRYYYAIYDMVVEGSCFCYGHANACIPADGAPTPKGMVHGSCNCTHNTKGLNCKQCDDLFNDQEWKPAVGTQLNPCKKCNCNHHAKKCHFDSALYEATGHISGGMCDDCEHGTHGTNCEQCKPFFYQDPELNITDPHVCKGCDCDPQNSLNGECDPRTDCASGLIAGRCRCKPNAMGRRCDRCKGGFWNNQDGCEPILNQEVPHFSICDESSCYPDVGNLLIGRENSIRASSTRGATGIGRNQPLSRINFNQNRRLHYGVENVIPRPEGNRNTWWQSENGVDGVSIRLDLEAEFNFTSLNITFKSIRPAAMFVERSKDFGSTWKVYQYFAHDCAVSFPGVRLGPRQKITDVVCDSQYSGVEPSTGGKVIFEVLPSNIKTDDPYSFELVDLFRMTNLRINFTKLYALGEGLGSQDKIEEKSHYAIYDIAVHGSCSCYGHASRCIPLRREPFRPGKVHSRCDCDHNTKGLNCEMCDDLYNDQSWKPAVGEQTNACKKCNCNGHAKRCHFDFALFVATQHTSGGVCDDCEHNTFGRNCELCKPYFYQDPELDIEDPDICKACNCDTQGSLNDGMCDSRTDCNAGLISGRCHCKANVEGRRCDRCKNGFRNLKAANPDGCEPVASQVSTPPSCDESSCYPATGNLLVGREDQIKTFYFPCRSNPDFEENAPFYHRLGKAITWVGDEQNISWQSENGEECVSMQLDLEELFNFTSLDVTFKSTRPAEMLLERSYDFGRTWKVYQYFAYDCAESFPGIPVGPRKQAEDVVCDSQFSGAEPPTGGKVIFQVLPRNIAIDDPYAPEFQNLFAVTNLRINFTRLHTQGENSISEANFYAINGMTIEGSCSCYGHANRCIALNGAQSPPGKVHSQCDCTHNTKGLNCKQCKDLFNDQQWKPAVAGRTNECRECSCNGHAEECHFDPAQFEATQNTSGGVCDDCKHNTAGIKCETCKPLYYQEAWKNITDPNICQACQCHPIGSFNGICQPRTDTELGLIAGQCRCRHSIVGLHCDNCQRGYGNFPNCFG